MPTTWPVTWSSGCRVRHFVPNTGATASRSDDRVTLVRARVVVLVSGGGTNLQALMDAQAAGAPFDIIGVVADRPNTGGIHRACEQGIPSRVVDRHLFADAPSWDRSLADVIAEMQPEWIVCAGFMRILGRHVLAAYPERVVNTHPSLLPAFPGAHAVRDALAYGVKVTGVTVHLVDDGIDTGPIIAQRAVEIREGDVESVLHQRIKDEEHRLLVDVVSRLCTSGCSVTDRRVSIP
jgi:phosphoribosylglycinamide formyltransferase 1